MEPVAILLGAVKLENGLDAAFEDLPSEPVLHTALAGGEAIPAT